MDLDQILDLFSQDRVSWDVLQQHDVAWETFAAPRVTVRDHQESKFLVASTNARYRGAAASVGAGVRDGEVHTRQDFRSGSVHEGYSATTRAALIGTRGGMRQVLNEIRTA